MRDLTIDAFTDDKKLEFIHDIAEALGVDTERIHLTDVQAGSGNTWIILRYPLSACVLIRSH